MDFNNLKNKSVVVMCLGLLGGGVEVVKWLHKKGAKVLVTDLKSVHFRGTVPPCKNVY